MIFAKLKKIPQKLWLRPRLFQGRFLVRHQGWSVFDELSQWDVIFLLDGCRFDTFKKVNFLPGKLEKRYSLGSCTPQWAQAALPKKPLKNLIYISANPFLSDFYLKKWQKQGWFYRLEPVWDYGWDKKLKTVPPTKVMSAFLRLEKIYPKLKFFVHLMQPHHPFIGKKRIKEVGWQTAREIAKGDRPKDKRQPHVYQLLEAKKVSQTEVIQAYEANLELVLGEIKKILPRLKGKKVLIMSDHGNLFGEYGLYSHPEDLLVPELITVPYFKVEI